MWTCLALNGNLSRNWKIEPTISMVTTRGYVYIYIQCQNPCFAHPPKLMCWIRMLVAVFSNMFLACMVGVFNFPVQVRSWITSLEGDVVPMSRWLWIPTNTSYLYRGMNIQLYDPSYGLKTPVDFMGWAISVSLLSRLLDSRFCGGDLSIQGFSRLNSLSTSHLRTEL